MSEIKEHIKSFIDSPHQNPLDTFSVNREEARELLSGSKVALFKRILKDTETELDRLKATARMDNEIALLQIIKLGVRSNTLRTLISILEKDDG
jgi:hypothetical protein